MGVCLLLDNSTNGSTTYLLAGLGLETTDETFSSLWLSDDAFIKKYGCSPVVNIAEFKKDKL